MSRLLFSALAGLVCMTFATRPLTAQGIGQQDDEALTAGESEPLSTGNAGKEAGSLLAFVTEITRFYGYGFSALSEASLYFPLSARAAAFFMQPLYLNPASPVYFYELPFDSRHKAALFRLFGRADTGQEAASRQGEDKKPVAAEDAINGSSLLDLLDNRAGSAMASEAEESRYYVDSSDSLRRFSYGEEQFAAYQLDGLHYMVNSDGKHMVRNAYDSTMRLVQSETFSLPSDAKKLSRLTVKNVRYDGDSLQPSEISFTDEKNATRTLSFYKGSLLVGEERYHSEKEEDSESLKEVMDTKITTVYDELNRVTAEQRQDWTYTKKGKKAVTAKKSTRRYLYDWQGKGGKEKPDSRYYEDDVLRIQKVYESPAAYTETLFFDGGFSVQTDYENHMKKCEVIFLNGKEQRRRTFEY